MILSKLKEKFLQQKKQNKKADELRFEELRSLKERTAEQDKEYQNLLRIQLQNQRPDPEPTILNIETTETGLIDFYMSYMEDIGQKNVTRPELNDENRMELSFPSKNEAHTFFNLAAQKHHSFIVIDGKTDKVIGYSNGDGKLYHADGTSFKEGDAFNPSNIDISDFKMPSSQVHAPKK